MSRVFRLSTNSTRYQIRTREGFIEKVEENRKVRFGERSRSPEDGGESEEERRALQVAQPSPPKIDPNVEVTRLQQMVLDLQRQLLGPIALPTDHSVRERCFRT